MVKKKSEVQELSEFIRDNMVTRKEFHEEIAKLATKEELRALEKKMAKSDDLQRVEMKVDGVEKRLDYELDHRKKLEVRVTRIEKKVGV